MTLPNIFQSFSNLRFLSASNSKEYKSLIILSVVLLLLFITLAALIFVGFLTGTIIVETVFVWPGLGLLATTAVSENDFPVMTGSVLLFAVFYTVIIFLSDLTYGFVDPRIRYS